MTTRTFSELLDELNMFAGQLQDHIDDSENSPPHPWCLDDWLAEYRDAHEQVFPK